MSADPVQEVLDVQRVDVWGAMRPRTLKPGCASWRRTSSSGPPARRTAAVRIRRADDLVPGEVTSIACHDLQAQAFGSAVVVTGVQHALLRMGSGANLEDFTMMTNVFEQRDGRWVLVLAHALSLPM